MFKIKNNTPVAEPSDNLDYRRKCNSNTWGFSRKIGEHTFGDYHYQKYTYEIDQFVYWKDPHQVTETISCTWNVTPEQRTNFRNFLRKATRILDVAGYIPGVALLAGTIRIIAAGIFGHIIEKNIRDKVYTGDLAEEARRTYQAQRQRGCTELIPVIGSLVNLYKDVKWEVIWKTRPVGNLINQGA